MIEKLIIHNIGLVENIEINFYKGFTVFTGETGAGKSMLLSALLLLLGDKASAQIIRTGSIQGEVSAQWNIKDNNVVLHWLQKYSISHKDDSIIVRRVLKKGRKSECFVQNTLITLEDLGELSQYLCDVHAQHEHQQLFKSSEQRAILDSYAMLTEFRENFSAQFKLYKTRKSEWENYKENELKKKNEFEEFCLAVEEIDTAQLKDNEDEHITQELTMASQKELLSSLWREFNTCIQGEANNEDRGAILLLEKSYGILHSIEQHDVSYEYKKIIKRFQSILLEIKDIVSETSNIQVALEGFDSCTIARLEQRLSQIELLKKKYGGTLEKIKSFEKYARTHISSVEDFKKKREEMLKQLKIQSNILIERSEKMSKIRIKMAKQFSEKVNKVLHNLAMTSADFKIEIQETKQEKKHMKWYGYDTVKYIIRSNTGEKYHPIASIASGGELSRIMLAIRVVNSAMSREKTLVLDEIDAGIGGKTARLVAGYLNMLAKKIQIICVTHLPIVAACAHFHYHIYKIEKDGRTFVNIKLLKKREKESEIARMLVGNEKDTLAKTQARQMLGIFAKGK